MNIGFIGLGIMGAPMAGHLMAGGHQIITCIHKTPAPKTLIESGLEVVETAKEVAKNSEIIIVMVPDTPQVQDVLFNQNGIAEGLTDGKPIIDMSSISPIETKEFSNIIKSRGCGYLDAPVSGGELGAKAASLTIMVGGSEEDFSRALPIFELMGSNITLVGENGVGQTTKVANQIIVALTIEAVGEALNERSSQGFV